MRKKTLCQALNIYGVHNDLIHYWWRSKSFFKRIWNYIAKIGDYRERMCNAKCTNLIMEIVQVVALATSTSTINTIHLMAETRIYRDQMHKTLAFKGGNQSLQRNYWFFWGFFFQQLPTAHKPTAHKSSL